MKKDLRQKVLKELKNILNEQEDIEQTSSFRGRVTSGQIFNILNGEIKPTPTQTARLLRHQNDNTYTNVDEARAVWMAFKLIQTPEQCAEFIKAWGSNRIHLEGNFFSEGRQYQDAIEQMGLQIRKKAMQSSENQNPPSPVTPPVPSPTTDQTGKQRGNSFMCKDPLSAGIFQQWLGVASDCKIGPNTIKAAQGKGLKLDFNAYFPADDDTKKANQQTFCQSLINNKEGYVKALKDKGVTPIEKCSSSAARSKGAGPSKTSILELIRQVDLATNQGNFVYKHYTGNLDFQKDLKAAQQQGKLTKQFIVDEYNKISVYQPLALKESKKFKHENYYNYKKLNEAKQLYNKLLKNV